MPEPFITKGDIPSGTFGDYRKLHVTRAMRMDGTFHCLTSEGNVASCTDGWLAIDSRGYPYPINAAEFDLTYERLATEELGSRVKATE